MLLRHLDILDFRLHETLHILNLENPGRTILFRLIKQGERRIGQARPNLFQVLPPLYTVTLRSPTANLEYRAVQADPASLETLMLQRPELQAAKQEYEQAEQALRIARYERWLWFQLGPAFRREENEPNHAASELGPAFGLELPIFNFNRGAIMSAEAERDRLYESFVSRVHETRAEMNEAYRNLKAQEQLITLFQSDIK